MAYKKLRVFAVYNDKAVDCGHLPEKQRFHLACCRVTDNAKAGFVVEGNNVYAVSQSFKSARIIKDAEARKVVLSLLPFTERPVAAAGFTSYRYRGPHGWIMIGASGNADALKEARRSTDAPVALNKLEVWRVDHYEPVEAPNAKA